MMRRMLLSLACALVLCLGLPTTALAARNVLYIDGDGNSKTIFEATEITSGHTKLTRGWYVVYGDVTISERIEVTGDDPTTCYVSLILADGCTLTASKGIGVEEGASLFIYGQSEDEGTMGKLYASSSSGDAAIGGDINFKSDTNGPITINGGRIEARSSVSGSAIGGGWNAPGGPVAINGGVVSAYATGGGAAIGGGSDANGYSKGGTVEIAGGSVTAISAAGAAIGGGAGNSDHGTLTIAPKSGRLVSASSGDDAEHARALAGSPFMSGTSVQVSIDEMGRKYFSCSTTKLLTVSHLDENGVERTRTDCLPVVAGDEQWKDGWYAVDSNVSVERRIVVDGDVNLILADGNALNVKGGIEVTKGNSLTIYAQSTDKDTMGSLTATTRNSGFADCAAIGGGAAEDTADAGTITIHGGAIKADNAGGYSRAAGIGGGFWNPDGGIDKADAGKGGTVTITGGVVTAFGGWNAAGIGGGQQSDGGSLTITGGTVIAQTDKGVSAVGAGRSLASSDRTDPGTLKIAPAKDQAIAGIAGADEKSAIPVDGSPFTAERDIIDLVQSASYFRSATGSINDVTCISVQPKGATVDEDDTATFEVSASGTGTLSYQWQQRSGADGEWTDIEGANGASYTTPATTADMDGIQFRCVVTGGLGIAASDPATLTVIAKPVFKISLDPVDVDFGKIVEGSLQGQVQPVTIMISNTGNQPLEIQVPQSEAFELELETSSAQLDSGDAVEVSIVPKDSLDVRAYSESVVISGINGQNAATASLELSVTVVHDLAKVAAKPATCTEDGNDEYWACEACGKVFGDADGNEEIKPGDAAVPATGHDPADGWERDAGGHWRACLNGCGERLEYGEHEPEVVGAKEPTCTEDGSEGDTVCSVCGLALAEGGSIPATGHDWGEDGRCKLCGAMSSSSTSTDNADDDRETLAGTGDGSMLAAAALSALALAAVAAGALAPAGPRRS